MAHTIKEYKVKRVKDGNGYQFAVVRIDDNGNVAEITAWYRRATSPFPFAWMNVLVKRKNLELK